MFSYAIREGGKSFYLFARHQQQNHSNNNNNNSNNRNNRNNRNNNNNNKHNKNSKTTTTITATNTTRTAKQQQQQLQQHHHHHHQQQQLCYNTQKSYNKIYLGAFNLNSFGCSTEHLEWGDGTDGDRRRLPGDNGSCSICDVNLDVKHWERSWKKKNSLNRNDD